jgi:hypothetical protein
MIETTIKDDDAKGDAEDPKDQGRNPLHCFLLVDLDCLIGVGSAVGALVTTRPKS